MTNSLRTLRVRFFAVVEGALFLLSTALLVLIALQVFTRYVLQASLPWTEEVARMVLVWMVMLGADLVLPGSLVKNPRLDYVALGHIHKAQNLNEGQHPPVIYPGSIERVDFGEAGDDKFFIIAEVEKQELSLMEM